MHRAHCYRACLLGSKSHYVLRALLPGKCAQGGSCRLSSSSLSLRLVLGETECPLYIIRGTYDKRQQAAEERLHARRNVPLRCLIKPGGTKYESLATKSSAKKP